MAEAALSKQVKRANYIINFSLNTYEKAGPTRQTLGHFQSRLQLLEKYWASFDAEHFNALEFEASHPQHEYFEKDGHSVTELAYLEARAKLVEDIARLTQNQRNEECPVQNRAPEGRSSASLPALALPTFSGKQEDWESFKQRFMSVLSTQPNLSEVSKLQHLLNSVQGAAAQRLKGMAVVEANFVIAWERLTRRYDNRHLRLANHVETLIQLPQVRSRNVSDLTSLVDRAEETVQALVELDWPIEKCNPFVVHCMVRKLDINTREAWNVSQEKSSSFPVYKDLTMFLERRIQSLEQSHSCSYREDRSKVGQNSKNLHNNNSSYFKSVSANVAREGQTLSCILCKSEHSLYVCSKFKELSQPQRFGFCKRESLCLNCLTKGHRLASCPSKRSCSSCGRRHHSLLHAQSSSDGKGSVEEAVAHQTQVSDTESMSSVGTSSSKGVSKVRACTAVLGGGVLLATASIVLSNEVGTSLRLRALIDPAAERSFMSHRVVSFLSLPSKRVSVSVIGVGSTVSARSSCEVQATITSTFESEFRHRSSFIVLNELSRLMPSDRVNLDSLRFIEGLKLADEQFHMPGRIDVILGADVYPQIIRDGLRKGPSRSLVAQRTAFGWTLMGTCRPSSNQASSINACHTRVEVALEALIARFWELEEIPGAPIASSEDQYCEDYFRNTTVRNSEGRYVVRLPFKKQGELVGSRDIALACLTRSEKRRLKNADIDEAYGKFMSEYQLLGHMRVTPPEEIGEAKCYLPHHAAFRHDASKKIRVVFNASQRSASGNSLNDFLYVGPKLQADIAAVLTRWRFYRYVFSTDIVKMFRQILVHSEDLKWQHVLWRTDNSQSVQDLQALTVTYGTAPAPFLAIRTLLQLAKDGSETHPEAAYILRKQVYVDDIFSGGDSLAVAQQRRDQLIALMATAQMELGKWAANHAELLSGLSSTADETISVDVDEVVSTLGLKWNVRLESFVFTVDLPDSSPVVTKRVVLSEMAQLFDPLGFLSPVIIVPKILMQDLWLEKVSWDEPLSDELRNRWHAFRESLLELKQVRIPRFTGVSVGSVWRLHGFCDASQRAYAAVIYSVADDGRVTLLMAKSKVAPVKTQSVPRLELCGALLLVRLASYVLSQVEEAPASVSFWSDSKVVLDWLRGHPSRWPVFIANRVSEILTLLPTAVWRHVVSSENSADCATRGLTPGQLAAFDLWWFGPVWLSSEMTDENAVDVETSISEEKQDCMTAAVSVDNRWPSLGEENELDKVRKFSNILKILRIFAFCFRWRFNVKLPEEAREKSGFTVKEWKAARFALFRCVQSCHFKNELTDLRAGRSLSTDSRICRLLPFIDSDEVLRVGGRLHNAPVGYGERHPVILPGGELIVRRLVEYAHIVTLHGGVRLMLSYLSRFCWIVQGPRLVQGVFRRCVRCARFAARASQQQMAPLPAYRFRVDRPFSYTGVDFAGPFAVRLSKGRGTKSSKGYVAIFVCMVIKAVHIEVVSDLSTQAFLAAFHRFTARRGVCIKVFSDNGTKFKGAAAEITSRFLQASKDMQEVLDSLAQQGVAWEFIPPRAPHFGGLWEAAVKSFKHHLHRVMGQTLLTFEEFSTLSAQIEACLNSRPICPLNSQGGDEVALTPGHFLVGSALLSVPEPCGEGDGKVCLSSRWQLVTSMSNSFWNRWKKEAWHQLQLRNKWLKTMPNLAVDDVVLIKDELSPPRTLASRPRSRCASGWRRIG